MLSQDLSLFGGLTLRLLGDSVQLRRFRARLAETGRLRAELEPSDVRTPDVTLRIWERLAPRGAEEFAGGRDLGFADERLWVRGKGREYELSLAPQRSGLTGAEHDSLGAELNVTAQAPSLAIFGALLDAYGLERGSIPVHAAAFVHQGHGVLVTGWPHSSKSGALLAFMARGASFVSDDWIALDADGRSMCGNTRPIRANDGYLAHLPELRRRLPRTQRWRTGFFRRLSSQPQLSRAGASVGRYLPTRLTGWVSGGLRKLYTSGIDPLAFFGPARCVSETRPDVVLWLVSGTSAEIEIEPVEPHLLAQAQTHSCENELGPLFDACRRFGHVYPHLASPRMERFAGLYRDKLEQALGDKRCFRVLHPYPAPLQALEREIAEQCLTQPPTERVTLRAVPAVS